MIYKVQKLDTTYCKFPLRLQSDDYSSLYPQSGLSAEVLEEFKHFWNEDFEVVHRELGCAIICMSNKFSLMEEDSRMHHVNMHDYVKSFPNGK